MHHQGGLNAQGDGEKYEWKDDETRGDIALLTLSVGSSMDSLAPRPRAATDSGGSVWEAATHSGRST